MIDGPRSSSAAPLARRAIERFSEVYGGPAELLARAPGRVNLIGDHTDYNEGFVLPLALPLATWMAGRARTDNRVRLESDGHPPVEFRLGETSGSDAGWGAYPIGVAAVLVAEGLDLVGFEGVVVTDNPVGAGLSSSAALEIAVALSLLEAAAVPWDPRSVALWCVAAERDQVGVPVGEMDQLIVALAVEDNALLIDCRDRSTAATPIPEDVTVVVLDTSTRRDLAASHYAERRAACERVASTLGVRALRDVSIGDLEAAVGLDPVDVARARHVIDENARTIEASRLLAAGEVAAVGRLMSASHASLRDLFEVSGPALDAIVEAAESSPGCLGARMTGGGFAGCAVALVRTTEVRTFSASVRDRFRAASDLTGVVHPCRPAPAAAITHL